jgi:hypothetical protein
LENINDIVYGLVLEGLSKNEIIEALQQKNYTNKQIEKATEFLPTIPLLEFELYNTKLNKSKRLKIVFAIGIVLFITGFAICVYNKGVINSLSGTLIFVGLFCSIAGTSKVK